MHLDRGRLYNIWGIGGTYEPFGNVIACLGIEFKGIGPPCNYQGDGAPGGQARVNAGDQRRQ